MFGREPCAGFAALVGQLSVQLKLKEEEQLPQLVQRMVEAREEMRWNAEEATATTRQKSRVHASQGDLPHFTVRDYVL